jgi:hypothetical protein
MAERWCGLSSGYRKSLIEVGQDVVDVLDADAQAQQIRRDAGTEGFEFHGWLEEKDKRQAGATISKSCGLLTPDGLHQATAHGR